MAERNAVYILAAKRTPFGKFWGTLKGISAPQLGSEVIRGILQDTGVSPELIDGVYMGEVLTALVGQNPGRQAALYARLLNTCDARTFNKVCSSSLVALDHAADKIMLGKAHLMIAGGMENMSRAPYVVSRSSKVLGNKLYSILFPNADVVLIDSMIHDGLLDIYDSTLPHMGELADRCAKDYQISRDEQEEFSAESHARALRARQGGLFDSSLVPILAGDDLLDFDEGVREPSIQKMKELKPAFGSEGLITAATSSQISDGAAALLLSDMNTAKKLRIRPMARIVAVATYSHAPEWYTTAPVGAIQKVLGEAGLRLQDIDLFEINEAFAVVPLYAMREFDISHEKVNIWGGAIAVGHPIGASGARITMNVVYQLMHTGGRYGIAVACNGGGEAVAVLIENMQQK